SLACPVAAPIIVVEMPSPSTAASRPPSSPATSAAGLWLDLIIDPDKRIAIHDRPAQGDGMFTQIVRATHDDRAAGFAARSWWCTLGTLARGKGLPRLRHFIVGITNSAPSLAPDGQREVTVFVFV